jgi:hypothetical protein
MDVKDYCRNVDMELTSWKAKLYDVIRKIDAMPTGDKQKMSSQIEGFHMIMAELDDRIDKLRTECPTEWSPQQREIHGRIDDLATRLNQAEGALHDYDFGG